MPVGRLVIVNVLLRHPSLLFLKATAHWFAGACRLPYLTFRNLCNERRLSGRGLSAKICGQPVHDTSPT